MNKLFLILGITSLVLAPFDFVIEGVYEGLLPLAWATFFLFLAYKERVATRIAPGWEFPPPTPLTWCSGRLEQVSHHRGSRDLPDRLVIFPAIALNQRAGGSIMSINHRDPDLLSVPDLDAAIAQEFDLTARAYASDPRAAAELWLYLVDDKGWMPVTNPWQVDSPYEVAIWAVRGEKLADPLATGWGNSREEALARAALLADYAAQTKE